LLKILVKAGAQLYVDIKENPDSRLVKIKTKPSVFNLLDKQGSVCDAVMLEKRGGKSVLTVRIPEAEIVFKG
jgi:predicted DNA-binding protein (MmcQ/YjbR family)